MEFKIIEHNFFTKVSFLFVCLIIIGCKNNTKNKTAQSITASSTMKTYEWLPSESAPKHYPVEIYQGDFITDSGEYIEVPKGGTVKNGWGNIGSTWAIGEKFKPVPSKLAIIYISFTEDQFYAGEFQLPKDKITELFEKGFVNNKGVQKKYNKLLVGLAPGGAVSVWLSGVGSTVEVGHYRASKTNVSMKDFNPDGIQDREAYVKDERNNFTAETKEVLEQQGVPLGKWTKYRERFRWRPKFEHKGGGKMYRFLNDFYNGEYFNSIGNNPLITKYQDFPPPKRVAFRWSDKKGNKYGCKVYFNETEIWNAFKKIYANSKTSQAELVLEIDKYNSEIKLYLRSNNDEVLLEKTEVKIFEANS